MAYHIDTAAVRACNYLLVVTSLLPSRLVWHGSKRPGGFGKRERGGKENGKKERERERENLAGGIHKSRELLEMALLSIDLPWQMRKMMREGEGREMFGQG